jgi:hypothetical protein
MENGNFEIRPTMKPGRQKLLVIIVEQNLIRAVGIQLDPRQPPLHFDEKLPDSELILSFVRENAEYKFADVEAHRLPMNIDLSYSSHPRALTPKVPMVKICRCTKQSMENPFLGRQTISITPKNIDRFSRLYTNRAAVTSASVLFNENLTVEVIVIFHFGPAMSIFHLCLATFLEYLFPGWFDKCLNFWCFFNRFLSLSLIVSVYLVFLVLCPLEGRLIRFMHKNSIHRIIVQGIFLLGFPIVTVISFLFPNFMIAVVFAIIAWMMKPWLKDTIHVLLFLLSLIFNPPKFQTNSKN